MYSLNSVIDLFRRGRSRDARRMCEALLEQHPDRADALDVLAQIQFAEGCADDAISNWIAATALDSTNAVVYRRLGGALLAAGRELEAAAAFRHAILLEPDEARAHNNLGQSLARVGDHEGAMRCYHRALVLQPSYAIAHNNLGLALSALGRHETALDHLRRAVVLDQHLQPARINLAVEFEKLHRLQEALRTYDDALRVAPDCEPCCLGKAALSLVLGRFDEALLSADRALALRRDSARGFALRGAALSQLHRNEDAAASFDQALKLDPAQADVWCDSALVAQNRGDYQDAQARYRHALTIDSRSIRARTGLLTAHISALPNSQAEVAPERDLLDREFQAFQQWLASEALDRADTIGLASQEFFYLSYRDAPNLPFVRAYRTLAVQRMAAFFPPRARATTRTRNRRFRVGFVSAHVRDHAVYDALLRGWLERLDRTHFEICLFDVGTIKDAVTTSAARLVDYYDTGTKDIAAWVETIDQRDCDAMIFPEIGMDRTTLALASVRHAPRQFVAWGHPQTSGLPSIDCFFSSSAFEPAGAQAHYTEQLIRLPNLGVYYKPYATAPEQSPLETLNLADVGTLYICAGTPFKYAPQHDAVFTGIARRMTYCTFVFFIHPKQAFSTLLKERIVGEFRRAGLDADRYLRFIPWQPRPAFLDLLRSADVFLDTLGFSGFNTVMQAVEANLPCVAHEGEYLRGRLGSGILRGLALEELVANSPAVFVDIAVKLGQSSAYRSIIRKKMRQAASNLYADQSAIDGLSTCLLAPQS